MWDLTITGDHDFFVTLPSVAVLVHNCGPEDLNYNQVKDRINTHTWSLHGYGTSTEGSKFAAGIDGNNMFEGLINRFSAGSETGVIDPSYGTHEHIIPWPGAGAMGENFVRVWMFPNGELGGMWPIQG